MYKTKKEIEKWIKAFNAEQVERMKKDGYEGDELDEFERFRGGGEWSVEMVAPQALLDLLPEWESENWWEVGVVIDDDGEGICQDEEEALEEFEVKSIDDINPIFTRRFYELSLEEEEYWVSLEKEYAGKTGLPYEEIRVSYG